MGTRGEGAVSTPHRTDAVRQAVGDDAVAESRAAIGLAAAGVAGRARALLPKPIRVLGPMDVYALLYSSGLQFATGFPEHPAAALFHAERGGWDDVGVERHLAPDYIDAVNAISVATCSAIRSSASCWRNLRGIGRSAKTGDRLAGGQRGRHPRPARREDRGAAAGNRSGGLVSLATAGGLRPPAQRGCADGGGRIAAACGKGTARTRCCCRWRSRVESIGTTGPRRPCSCRNRRWYDDGALVLFAQTGDC